MFRLTVACGGGIVTTTLVTDQLKDALKKAKIQHRVTPAKITQIANIQDQDMIVVTGKTTVKNVNNIPIMIGISLIMGVGDTQFIEEFLKRVKEIEEAKTHGSN
jgi:galactitol-specific phosphotransferase system IIB component